MKKNLKRILFALCFACAVLFTVKCSVNTSAATKKYTLKIYNNTGKKLVRKYKVASGTKVTLPTLYESNTKVILGFSKKKKQHSYPSYLVGQTITVKKNITLYNVIFYLKNEKSIPKKDLLSINDVPYKNVIFVGDSRTYYLFERELVKSKYPALHKNIYHIAVSGSKYPYLKGTAYPQLLTLLSKLNKQKTAIVFNHGVNDLEHINYYISFMKQIAPTLKKYNCKLFYMSVNPMSVANRNYWKKVYQYTEVARTEANLLTFNRKIKASLCGTGKNYTYIDTFTYLINNGLSYYWRPKTSYLNDGLHYTAKTEKRIYQYVMYFLKKH